MEVDTTSRFVWIDPMEEEALGCLNRTKSVEEIVRPARKKEARLVSFDEETITMGNTDPLRLEKLADFNDTPSKLPPHETEEASSCASNKVFHTRTSRLLKSGGWSPADNGEASNCYIIGEKSGVRMNIEANGDAEDFDGNHEMADSVPIDKTAKSRLIEICAVNYWRPPSFVSCGEEGAHHERMFSYKVFVKVETVTSTLLECFGEPRAQKKAAKEHAAEGALWFLKHLGYSPKN